MFWLKPFAGLDVVLYTDFDDTGKFSNPIPTELARLAIESAKASAGAKGLDGISYLAEAKKAGIRTPLMSEYEQEVLKQLGVESLEDAIAKIKAAPLVIYG